MYNHQLHQEINACLKRNRIALDGNDDLFYTRFVANAAAIDALFREIYGEHPLSSEFFNSLIQIIVNAYLNRAEFLKLSDYEKQEEGHWFLSNKIAGMSLYVDRFCGNLKNLREKLDYFSKLGVNLLHLMPIFESPPAESDGGYAVSDFRNPDARFGTLDELRNLRLAMQERGMYLMLDIVLNHTSHKHAWAESAKKGDVKFQEYYYMYSDRSVPDLFEQTMPEIFPESAPGNFTWVNECRKWTMSVFHQYQWDLNYANPNVFLEMLDNIFFYANLGVDILRIDAPAFIWKQIGTTCQNLPQAHNILRLIKQCVNVAAPGMALLGEAIVAPSEIMKYFGTGLFTARECDFAYNATQMALQWDALATGDIRIMLAAQHEMLQKPFGTSWITYTRCHDDIGLGYDDYMILQAGFNPFEHRKFLQEYYSGKHFASEAAGALFSVNQLTQDARISGSLASLCGLEKAITDQNESKISQAINKILMMQAHSFFIGGLPMIFYGDELGYTNDYSYLTDSSKNYDNRWMHRPMIDWNKAKKIDSIDSVEEKIFTGTRKLIDIRSSCSVFGDYKNLTWMTPHKNQVAAFLRTSPEQKIYCLFNFSNQDVPINWSTFSEHGKKPEKLFDHWNLQTIELDSDDSSFIMKPYGFLILEAKN